LLIHAHIHTRTQIRVYINIFIQSIEHTFLIVVSVLCFVHRSNSALKVWNSVSYGVTTLLGALASPKGVAVNAAGTLLCVGDSANERILVWNISLGGVVAVLGGRGSGFYPSTVGMRFDSSGNLWVTDVSLNAIVMWNATTNSSAVTVTGLNGPRDVQVRWLGPTASPNRSWCNRPCLFHFVSSYILSIRPTSHSRFTAGLLWLTLDSRFRQQLRQVLG
jgi:hypothetical protein